MFLKVGNEIIHPLLSKIDEFDEHARVLLVTAFRTEDEAHEIDQHFGIRRNEEVDEDHATFGKRLVRKHEYPTPIDIQNKAGMTAAETLFGGDQDMKGKGHFPVLHPRTKELLTDAVLRDE